MYNASFIAAVFLALILIYSISRLSELYTYLFWVLVSEFKHNIPGSLLCVYMCICAILESVAQQYAFTYCAAEFDRRCSYSKSALFTLASSVQSCVAYIHKLSAIHAIFYSYMQMVYVRPSISVFFNKFVSVSPTYIFRAFVLTDIVLIVFVHLAYRHSALYYCIYE